MKTEKIRYYIPVNEGINETTTMKIITIEGTPTKRRTLLTKYLKFEFNIPRTHASKIIQQLGFDDLIPTIH